VGMNGMGKNGCAWGLGGKDFIRIRESMVALTP
jgi:hypothetical protein